MLWHCQCCPRPFAHGAAWEDNQTPRLLLAQSAAGRAFPSLLHSACPRGLGLGVLVTTRRSHLMPASSPRGVGHRNGAIGGTNLHQGRSR